MEMGLDIPLDHAAAMVQQHSEIIACRNISFARDNHWSLHLLQRSWQASINLPRS
jgi:hypothetical protein